MPRLAKNKTILILFVGVTLLAWVSGLNGSFLREDIMWIQILQGQDIDARGVFKGGIQNMFLDRFPQIDWPYRPIEHLLVPAELTLLGENHAALTLVKALFLGTNAMLIYLVAWEISRRKYVSLGSAVLFSLSFIALVESWWFHHMQTIVQLPILLAIYGYIRYVKGGGSRWLAVIWISSFIAPWIEEAGSSIAVIILVTAILQKRFDYKLILSLPILILHSIFPAFLPNLLIDRTIVTDSIFQKFVAGLAFKEGLFGGKEILSSSVSHEVILFLPLTLTILGLSSMSLYLMSYRGKYAVFSLLILIIFSVSLISMYAPNNNNNQELRTILSALFPITVAFASFKFGKLLPVWLIVSYIPFLRLPHLSVNLIPVEIPWIIATLLWVSFGFERVRDLRPRLELNRFANAIQKRKEAIVILMLAVVVIGVVAQAANIEAARATWHPLTNVREKIGVYAQEHLSKNAVMIGDHYDYYAVLDAAYYSNGKVKGVVTTDQPLLFPTDYMPIRNLQTYIAGIPGSIYFLEQQSVDRNFNRFLDSLGSDIVLVHTVSAEGRFVIVDPILAFIPVPYTNNIGIGFMPQTSFGGFEGSPFLREYRIAYNIYEYSPSIKLHSTYHDYNIFSCGLRYYATSQSDGSVKIERCREGNDSHLIISDSVDQIKKQIDIRKAKSLPPYRDFLIVYYRDRYYGYPESEQEFDPSRCMPGGYSDCVTAVTSVELRSKIDMVLELKLVTSYKNFNIIDYQGRYYAIPQGEGYFDIERFRNEEYSYSFMGDSMEEIEENIDRITSISNYN